jgi:voltage-gated potassium channel Kch
LARILFPLKRHTWSARLRYAFDNYMSRGTIALIGGLFVLSVLVILIVSVAIAISGALGESSATEGLSFPELVWRSLLRTLDPGTMGGDQGSVTFLLAMLTVTLGGIFVISTLIGVISNGIQGKLDELRKGRSVVLENDHTVILGWSAQIFEIIGEIVLANANRRGRCIVILAERDKVEMETEIRARVPGTRTTRVVCRSGSPMELADLAIANLQDARSVIVMSPERDDPDTDVIKTLLAVTNDPTRRSEPYRIVAEVRDARNVEVARLASRGEAQLVLGGELIGRIAAQTCRQPGLSVVYGDLLDFGGDEIYFAQVPALAGKSFGDALAGFRDSALIGLAPAEGTPHLNPPMDTQIGTDDQLIFIARDDDAIVQSDPPPGTPSEDLIILREHDPLKPDATLVLGWNSRTGGLLVELDRYAAAGSKLTVLADGPRVADAVLAIGRRLTCLELDYRQAETTDREVLDSVTAEGYDHVVVMSYADFLDEQRADALTLVTLLHLRDIEAQRGESFTIVSEMLDVRNRALAQVTRADDFIVSGKLVSQQMSQLAENPALRPVFDDLFDEQGSEIYLKPAGDYVRLGEPVDFYAVVESGRRRGEVCFGYRLLSQAEDAERNYGVVMNPDKSAALIFTVPDKIIVFASS